MPCKHRALISYEATANSTYSKRRFDAIARRHGFEYKEGKLEKKEEVAKPEGKVMLGLGKAAVEKGGTKKRKAPAAAAKSAKKQKVDVGSSEKADGEESEI